MKLKRIGTKPSIKRKFKHRKKKEKKSVNRTISRKSEETRKRKGYKKKKKERKKKKKKKKEKKKKCIHLHIEASNNGVPINVSFRQKYNSKCREPGWKYEPNKIGRASSFRGAI